MDITLVTSNPKKAEQFSRWLGFPVGHVALDLPELQTMDMETIVRTKAEAAYKTLGKPVIAEDTSLGFSAMKGLPGPFTKFFLEAGGAALLCRLADLNTDRSARYSVYIAYHDEHGTHIVHGDVDGSISKEPSAAGAFGFGFDQCFVPEGHAHPRAALSTEAFEESSARKKAIDALREWLHERK